MKTTSGTNIPTGVSLHKSNFEDYITKYAQTNSLSMSGDVWERALAAAKRLDYTGDRDAQPKMRLIPSQPSFVKRLMTRLLRRSRQRIHLTELDDIQAYLAQRASAQQSEFIWGPLRNGFGTWVIAILRPGGQQVGSRPTPPRLRDTPGWDLLASRRLLNGRVLYVRGHMLHNEPGGPGVDYNEVILTAASGGDFGANHANWVHRYLIEGSLLWAYRNMHRAFGTPTITEIYYQVVADYNRQPRKRTEQLRQITKAYEKAAKLVKGKLVAEGRRKEPTHQQVMSALAKNPFSPYLHDVCFAVAAKNKETWPQVMRRMEGNQELWAFEDANVPKTLQIRYSWIEHGVLRGPWQETVSIILPTTLAARFEK